jgi:hypothetical protein
MALSSIDGAVQPATASAQTAVAAIRDRRDDERGGIGPKRDELPPRLAWTASRRLRDNPHAA